MSSDARFHTLTLGQFGEFKNGANFGQGDYGPGYPIVNVKQLYGGRYIDLCGLESLGKHVLRRPEQLFLEAGDILFARSSVKRSGAGQCALVPPGVIQHIFSGFIIRYRISDKEATNPMFLAYLLQSPIYREIFPRIATGTTISNLSQDALKAIQVSLPSKAIQDEVAAILGALDDRIALLRETNATLEAIAQTLFKSWFVDFDPVRAKQQGLAPAGMDEATAALFPDSFEESALGLVPKGWQAATIGTIAEVIDCLHSKKPEFVTEGRPFLQLSNIRDDGLLDTSGVSLVSDADYSKWISRAEATEGDCVITNVGRVGAVAQIPTGFRAAMGRNMTAIRLRNGWSYPTYLIELLQSESMRAEIQLRSDVGTILDALNVRNIPLLRCVTAPHDVMAVFETVCRPMRAAMEANIERTHVLGALRDTLLPRLISGQLRLPEATAEADEAMA
ncbi:MAG: restriction endonuclease subunit S [Burkholderiaceae bacterium]